MTTATDAIARSISHTETVHLPYDAAVMTDLLIACEDSTESGAETEYWGTDDGQPWRVHVAHLDEAAVYTYTIFDADPGVSGGTAWPSHEERDLTADSIADAIEAVTDEMSVQAAGLSPEGGYEVGQRLYALIWDADGMATPATYEITADDLGLRVATAHA